MTFGMDDIEGTWRKNMRENIKPKIKISIIHDFVKHHPLYMKISMDDGEDT